MHDQFRRRQLFANQIDVFGSRRSAADDGHLNARARLSGEEVESLAHGHVTRSEAADGLENIAAPYPGFGSGAVWEHREDDDVAVTLAQRQPGFPRAGIGHLFLVLIVFSGSKVAGLRIERLE